MDQLKLKYVIELVSNLGAKSKDEARVMTQAQDEIRKKLEGTNTQIGLMERALLRMGGVGNATISRQADYLAKLALRYHDVRKAAEGAVEMMGKAAKIGAGVAAGAAAGTYAVDRMTKTPMDFDLRLAHMANTAFTERDKAGRKSGARALNAAVVASIRQGGGTREGAADALDTMVAGGMLPVDSAMRVLPSIMKFSTAAKTDPAKAAAIVTKALQNGILESDIPDVLNMAMVSGQKGGFEVDKMAAWIPKALAAAKPLGMSGKEGLRRILGGFQASMTTAGTEDEAGNNYMNLMGKISAADTNKDVQKAMGSDLYGQLVSERAKGVNAIDAFIGVVDKIASKDKEYVRLQEQLRTARSSGDRAATLGSMADILQGKAVGKVVQDRQAMMALVAEMNQRAYVKDVMDATRRNSGEVDTAFSTVSDTVSFSRQQAVNEGQIAASTAFDRAAPALKSVADTGADVARQFPLLTASAVGATGALTAMAAFVGGGGLLRMIMGGAAGTAGAAGGGAVAGRVAAMAGAAAPVAGVVAAGGFAGWQTWRLGSALADWYGASHRQGVTLSAQSKARLAMTAPPSSATGGGGADPLFLQRQSLGQGVLDVRVRVDDQRVTTSSTVTTPMSLVRINPGNTNPGGYSK